MDNVEKLKGMILETVKGGVDEIKLEQEKLQEAINEVKGDVTKIKEAPVTKVLVGAPGETKNELIYNGVTLKTQGRTINEHAFRLTDEPMKNAIAKMMIDAIQAAKDGKPKYQMDATLTGETSGSVSQFVFDEFMNVIRSLGELYGIGLAECEVVNMNSDVLHYPVDNDVAITVAKKTETTAYSDGITAGMSGEITLTAKRVGAYAIITNQLMEDSTFDIVSFLMPKFAAAISRYIDDAIFTTGSTEFSGGPLVDAASIQDSTGTLDIGHLLDSYSKLDKRMSVGAKYYFHRLVHYGTILNQTDTAGNAIFPPNLTNMGKNLWDIPVVLAEDLPYTLTDGLTVGLCGNMRQAYVIGQRKGVGSFFFNPYSLDTSEQTRITLGTRWDGSPGFAKSMVRMIY